MEHQKSPLFQQIKAHLLAEIHNGRWKEGDLISSEQALVKEFGVSRMTVNRAVRELTADQVLTRRQGSGTFVAQKKYQATLLEIKSIADEVRARGHRHKSQLHQLEKIIGTDTLCQQFELPCSSNLFHSVIVHFDNDCPIQVEQRWVNPALAPDYLAQDFTKITPNEYLTTAAPLQAASYSVEALLAPPDIADMLCMDKMEMHKQIRRPMPQPAPEQVGLAGLASLASLVCLVLKRKTLSQGRVASVATMWHPGERYQFAGQVGILPGQSNSSTL